MPHPHPLPDDFHVPPGLDVANATALSPFLVPQTHLGSPALFRAMATFMVLLVALGVPLNGLTVLCTLRFPKLRSHLNYILVNLAMANLLVATVGSTTAAYSFARMFFVLGPTACKVEGFSATLGGMVSLWSLAVVAFERYLVVCKPLGSFTFRGSHALLGCAATWAFGLVAALPPLFGWSRYIPEGLQCSCGPDWYTVGGRWHNESYVLFLFCFCFGVPLAIIGLSYGRLLLTLRAVARQQEHSASTQQAEREVSRMVVVMVGGFLLCWGPYATFALWVVTHRGAPLAPAAASIPAVFSKASTICNPIIYGVMNRQFRGCLLRLLLCGRHRADGDDTSGASQGTTQVSSVSPAP
ncbi:blue-sensitive opsin-like [Aegotheles albertisi]